MKTTILLLSAMVISVQGNGQAASGKSTTSGKIFYEEKATVKLNSDGDAAHSAEPVFREQKSHRVLYFNSDYSLYQKDDDKQPDEVLRIQKSHTSFSMIGSGENDITFCDLKNGKRVEQKEFMTRTFLIDGILNTARWKLTGNSRIILGYNCLEAVSEEKENIISAWFTSAIPVSAGPAGFEGVPGMILLVDINSGKQTITATLVDPSFNDPSKLKMPQEGKKVTPEEYNRIVEEKLDEIRNNAGRGGGINRY